MPALVLLLLASPPAARSRLPRSRSLRREGVDDPNERYQIRWREAEEGTLSMPKAPAHL